MPFTLFLCLKRSCLNKPIDQAELISLLRRREQAGFNHLYEAYSGALFGIILRIIDHHETAEEVLSETFVKLWRNIDSYDPDKGSLFTWMLNIARNTAIDTVRSKTYSNQLKNQELHEIVTGNEPAEYDSPTGQLSMKDLLSKLDQEKKELICKAYFEGYTQAEIAESLGMPLGTVKTRMRAALKQLRDLYKN
jgi:RNA polymerase sigma factor (sigma-70 family)